MNHKSGIINHELKLKFPPGSVVPLKLYLQIEGVTQAELCEKIQCSRSRLSLWLNGRRAYLRRTEIKNLARELGLEEHEVLARKVKIPDERTGQDQV